LSFAKKVHCKYGYQAVSTHYTLAGKTCASHKQHSWRNFPITIDYFLINYVKLLQTFCQIRFLYPLAGIITFEQYFNIF